MDFYAEYFLLVFGSSFGVLQIAAARSRLQGLSFFKRPLPGYLFGISVVGVSFWWFFVLTDRNVQILPFQGMEMVECISLALVATLFLTLTVISLLKYRRLNIHGNIERGLEVLRQATYFQAINYFFRKRRKG